MLVESFANVFERLALDRFVNGHKFGIRKVRVINLGGLNQEVERVKVEGRKTRGGPPGFPRGHRAPVCYPKHNTKSRALAVQRP